MDAHNPLTIPMVCFLRDTPGYVTEAQPEPRLRGVAYTVTRETRVAPHCKVLPLRHALEVAFGGCR